MLSKKFLDKIEELASLTSQSDWDSDGAHPTETATWREVVDFCERASQLYGWFEPFPCPGSGCAHLSFLRPNGERFNLEFDGNLIDYYIDLRTLAEHKEGRFHHFKTDFNGAKHLVRMFLAITND